MPLERLDVVDDRPIADQLQNWLVTLPDWPFVLRVADGREVIVRDGSQIDHYALYDSSFALLRVRGEPIYLSDVVAIVAAPQSSPRTKPMKEREPRVDDGPPPTTCPNCGQRAPSADSDNL